MLWDPFLYYINDSIQGKSETDNKVFVLPSKVSINILGFKRLKMWRRMYHEGKQNIGI